MNERAKLAQTIVQTIEGFPKVHKFLTSGDTGCHPQHLVDTIAERIVESRGETLRENILTGFAAELKAMLDEALEENERLRGLEAAVTAYLTAKSIPAAKRAYTELWRASGLDREAFLRGEL